MNRDDLLETIVKQTGMIMDLTKQIEDLRRQNDTLQKQNEGLRALRSSTITSDTSSAEQTPTSPAVSVPLVESHVALSSYVHRPSVPPSASSSGDGDGDDTVGGPIRRKKTTRFQYQCPCGKQYIVRRGDYRPLMTHRHKCTQWQQSIREDGDDNLHLKKNMVDVYRVLSTYDVQKLDDKGE